MDALRKVTLKGLQKNKKRTLVTLVGVILATALITAVANMAESFRASIVEYTRSHKGDFHYCFQGVKQEDLKYFVNHRSIAKIGYEKDLGYALLPGSTNPDKPYVFVKAMNGDGMKAAALNLIEGRMPQTEEEIVVSGHIKSNGNVNIAVGDVLELNIGYREAGTGNILSQTNPYSYGQENFVEGETKTYTVVGIIKRPDYTNIEAYTAPGYTVVTFLDDGKLENSIMDTEDVYKDFNIYATYTHQGLRNNDKVTAGLLGVSSNVTDNRQLIQWELLDFSNTVMDMLYAMAAVAVMIIIFTSAFCIHNSFMISLSEKMRLYGMISSMGATKKQRRKMVYTEVICLGVVGIPLGVLCGVAATFILVKLTGRLMVTAMGLEFIYKLSAPAAIMGAILSIITIFLSAERSARKAGRLSPISAIQGSDAIKIKAKELRTPKLIHKLFGIGGTIAYKNLRRSRGKYRTTVISIVVSVSVYIAMTTFIQLAFKAGNVYYKNIGYQIRMNISSPEYGREDYEKALEILKLSEVTYGEIQRSLNIRVQTKNLLYTAQYREDVGKYGSFESDAKGLTIISLQDNAYEAYCKKVGVNPAQARDMAILVAAYRMYIPIDDRGNGKYVEGMKYGYRPGDSMTGILVQGEGVAYREKEISIRLAAQTDICPLGWQTGNIGGGLLVVNEGWMEQYEDYIKNSIAVYLQCKDASALETAIRNQTDFKHMTITNEQQEYEEERATHLLIAIFLYGFIAVIALIGITNIFNTVTTNMELRSREFAMLRAVGMTDKEFRRLVQLESLFYGVKALAIGIPLGILLSLCFHRALARGIETSFVPPIWGIAISVAAVFLLLDGIMRYSMGKIGQKNLIQTMQNENI